eukprot:CAMPEP_0117529712 /NCGR_PEP_ID=MMETSP0784-20121206/37972_1 /TAXON_ID=39447 /ORGANISM="" /LENGTH=373 /DNA_ID=CAMNT_0005326039 /DNA_START=63 /DNA_END=1184 /DNA_ORIENTATION=-
MTVEDILVLDGEVGGGIRKMVPQQSHTRLVPASILVEDPLLVRDLHIAYIEAGAQIITTNTYATSQQRVEELLQMGDRWEEMLATACHMAVMAREASGKDVLIAGSLPPLAGSYRPDMVGLAEELLPKYMKHVIVMAEYVDFFLCETMSTALEGWAAASAASKSGKPVWVSWNLVDDGSSRLRSGETLEQAWEAVATLSVDGVLVNCCMPETVTVAMQSLACMGPSIYGGYANGFSSIPVGWKLEHSGINGLGKRYDLTPPMYADFAQQWIDAGARVVGGCCEIGPTHIALLRGRFAPDPVASSIDDRCFAMNDVSMSSIASTRHSADFLQANSASTASSHISWCSTCRMNKEATSDHGASNPKTLDDIVFQP